MNQDLMDFAEELMADKYSKNFIKEIDERIYAFIFYSSEIHDVTDYKPDDNQITHGCLERHINKKVDVINFIRDYREDWGDDGGYCFYVGHYEGKFVLGSNYISYNNDFSDDFININKLEKIDDGVEYMLFDRMEELESFIERLIAKTVELNKEDPDWGYESWDLEEDDFESPFMHMCIRNLGSAFCENVEINTKRLQELTKKDVYNKNINDPVEFYNSWIEETNSVPVLKMD